ncbi:MAG: 5-formyltetrahydrofolate cyclo-ligase [Christensenellales bacterium]
MSTKTELRKAVVDKIICLTDEEKADKSKAIFDEVLSLDAYKTSKSVFCFMSDFNEPYTIDFIKKAIKQGKTVYVPKIDGDDMQAIEIDIDTEFWYNKFGILEPKTGNIGKRFDFTVVPLVAFDSEMNRLGRGKGYYDRFLSKNKTYKCGVAFDCQLVDKIETESTDVKLDVVISK